MLTLRAVKAGPTGVAFIDATAISANDRQRVPQLMEALSGKRFGDKGTILKHYFKCPFERGLQLITPIRKNMPNRLLPLFDKCLPRKRSLTEDGQ